MKIALVYPYIKTNFMGCNPPLSLLYLAGSLLQAKREVIVIDRDEDNQSIQNIMQKLDAFLPDVVGFPLFTNALPGAYEFFTSLLKHNRNWKILLGGPHATARPEEILDVFPGSDYVLRGESEKSIIQLVDCIEKGKGFESVEGLSYRHEGKIIHNPDSTPEKNLDSIRFPARELLESAYTKNTYWRIGHKGTTDILITSRGCPFNCFFCFKLSRIVQYRSPENILEELLLLKERGIKNVHIMDDLFVAPKSRCIKVLDLIIKNKLKMEFKVRSRVDLITDALLKKMKQAGVKAVVYGFESGSQKMLDLMNKGTSVEKNYAAVKKTKKAGLQCYADMFIGFPGETPQTIDETERFILKTKPTGLNIAIMYPLPKTEVYTLAKKKNMLINDWTVTGGKAWVKLPWIETINTLREYRKRILKKYLHNPVVMWNAFRHIITKIDFRQLKTLIKYYFQ